MLNSSTSSDFLFEKISPEIVLKIEAQIREIEEQEHVHIFFACENGSHAWGTASASSDYDVRFLYVHPIEWYLSIDSAEKKEVVEKKVSPEFDFSGWDFRKALRLLYSANPSLQEWLRSPLIYHEFIEVTSPLKILSSQFFRVKTCMYHYLHMAQGNFRAYLQGDQVWIKKYFYVLRPLLAIRWLEQKQEMPPIEFMHLVELVQDQKDLYHEILKLLDMKKKEALLEKGTPLPNIATFIQKEFQRLEKFVFPTESPLALPSIELLNQFFCQILYKIWTPPPLLP